ncbi:MULTISPECIES: methionine ABC transporter permease [Fischerella]|uniref:ABC transporter permease n=1 Tax=Fischerella muscicola CCMEE 5323 TaxID=2019572 RepID=A0A2N6K3M5_FISMU|nr:MULTISPECIES: methionine ABC transporter permease [Fischerella]MBD2433451.1 ABC transporter permease [Fischerella sp. FACHB-380]PLZ90213.1 ABC transporter permease [Fischerella muscicola CCMEE 5323]
MQGWELLNSLWQATLETFYMVGISAFVAVLLGLPLGLLLVMTSPGNVLNAPKLNQVLSAVVNTGRSFPFIILLVVLTPLTRLIVGTSIGSTAALVPLALAAIPFFARIAETSILEVDKGLVEAAEAMGCNYWQIVLKVLIPEALPSIVLGITILIVSLLNSSAMAGAVGGGGLGNLAIQYGYQRFDVGVMIATIVVLVFLVQFIQLLGDWLARQLRKK